MEDLDRFAFQAEAARLLFLILRPVFPHLILQGNNRQVYVCPAERGKFASSGLPGARDCFSS